MKILMVMISHDKLGNTGKKTGFWLEEFAAPYYTFIDAGATVTIASPKGGNPPLDPKSDLPENQTEYTKRFNKDPDAQDVFVEDELKRLGGLFEKAKDWQSFTIVDGHLITGQNPASSKKAAQALLKLLS